MVVTGQMPVEEFERIAVLPENADRRLEYVGGEVVEVVSNNYASMIAARIAAQLVLYVDKHRLGFVTGADGGYQVGTDRFIPDAAFISRTKQPEPPRYTWNPQALDLAVEVLSPTDEPDIVRLKIASYLSAGTVVWLVNPDKQQIEVYTPGQAAQRVGAGGTVTGGEILPGFGLAVTDIFAE